MKARAKKPAEAAGRAPSMAEIQARLTERVEAIEKNLAAPPPALMAMAMNSCEPPKPPIRQLGAELVTAAIDSARCGEHDRLVALTNAYVALLAADGRARA